MTRALTMTALAISTICRSPIESEPTLAVGIDIDAHLVERAFTVSAHRLAVDDAEAAGKAAEPEIFRHRHVRRELELLMDDHDASRKGVADRAIDLLLALDADDARIGGLVAREKTDQRRLAGAVFRPSIHAPRRGAQPKDTSDRARTPG